MNDLYWQDYESKMQWLKRLKVELDEKRIIMEKSIEGKPVPKEDKAAKIVINEAKLNAFKENQIDKTYKKLEANQEVKDGFDIFNAKFFGVLTLFSIMVFHFRITRSV